MALVVKDKFDGVSGFFTAGTTVNSAEYVLRIAGESFIPHTLSLRCGRSGQGCQIQLGVYPLDSNNQIDIENPFAEGFFGDSDIPESYVWTDFALTQYSAIAAGQTYAILVGTLATSTNNFSFYTYYATFGYRRRIYLDTLGSIANFERSCMSFQLKAEGGAYPTLEVTHDYAFSNFRVFDGTLGARKLCQTFVATETNNLAYLLLSAGRYGSNVPDTLYVEIYSADENHHPTGSALVSTQVHTGKLSYTGSPRTSGIFFMGVPIPNGPMLTLGQRYAIVIYDDSTTTNGTHFISARDQSGYVDGMPGYSLDGGQTWTTVPDREWNFIVYQEWHDPIKTLSADGSANFTGIAHLSARFPLSASGSYTIIGMADLSIYQQSLLSAFVPLTLSGSAALPAFWRAPVETGMRNYLVAAVKNKLYYGS